MTIITNPPYSGSLHLKILREAMKHGNKIVCLQPATYFSKTSLYKFVNEKAALSKHFVSAEIIPHREMNDLFGTGNSIEEGAITVFDTTAISNKDISKARFSSEEEYVLYDKILKPRNGKLIWRNGKNIVDEVTKPFYRKVYIWHGGTNAEEACLGPIGEKGQWTAQFDTQDELDNFSNFFKTKLANWCYRNLIVPSDYKIHMSMFVLDDYSHPWTDQMLYDYFGLTDEEIKIIEGEINE